MNPDTPQPRDSPVEDPALAAAQARAARSRAVAMDLGDEGRVAVRGDGALELLEKALTCDVVRQEDFTAREGLLLDEAGRVIDAATVLRLEERWLLICEDGPAVLDRLRSLAEGLEVRIEDRSRADAHLAICGPRALELLGPHLPAEASALAAGDVHAGSLLIARYVAWRSDRFGEWMLEVTLPRMLAGRAWRFVTETAGEAAAVPAGCAARQMLRIEAGRPGKAEFAEAVDPASADCLDRIAMDHEFAGRAALETNRQTAPPRRLCGLVGPTAVAGGESPAAPPAPGGELLDGEGRGVGRLTSVCRSANLDRVAVLAVVDRSAAGPLRAGEGGQALEMRDLPLYRPVRPD